MTRRHKKSKRRKAAGLWLFGRHQTNGILIFTVMGGFLILILLGLYVPIGGLTIIDRLIGNGTAPAGSGSGQGVIDEITDLIPGSRGGDLWALDEEDEEAGGGDGEEDVGDGEEDVGDGDEEVEEGGDLPDPPEWFECGGEVVGVLWVYDWYWQLCPLEWLGVAGQCDPGDEEIDIDIYLDGEYVDTVTDVRVGEIAELPLCCKWFCGILRITISQTDPHVVWICLQEEEEVF